MNDELFTDEPNNSDSDYTIDFIGYGPDSLTFGLYAKLNQFEHHLEMITTRYKYMALTWILAAYAGIGFILSGETTALPFNHLLGVAIICCIGLIGISLLWHLDMNVYQRFLCAIFIEEVIMEEKHAFLVQSRKSMLLIDDSRERISSQSLLYLTANSLLLITIFASLFFLLKIHGLFVGLAICCFFAIALTLNWFLIVGFSKKVENTFYKILEQRRLHYKTDISTYKS